MTPDEINALIAANRKLSEKLNEYRERYAVANHEKHEAQLRAKAAEERVNVLLDMIARERKNR